MPPRENNHVTIRPLVESTSSASIKSTCSTTSTNTTCTKSTDHEVMIENRVWKMILVTTSAFLHFRTFLACLALLLSFQQQQQQIDVIHTLTVTGYNIQKFAFMAYCLDLFCISQNVIPFSRADKAKDILFHHLPILLVVLPLGIPHWSLWTSADPTLFQIVYSTTNPDMSRAIVTNIVALDAVGFISSLNEMIMCLQRLEMLCYNKLYLKDYMMMVMNNNMIMNQNTHDKQHPHKHVRLMTTRWVIGFELYYKLLIFTVFPLINFRASVGVYSVFYNYTLLLNDTPSLFYSLKLMLLSPVIWRLTLYLMFMLKFYPFMAKRVYGRIKNFHEKLESY